MSFLTFPIYLAHKKQKSQSHFVSSFLSCDFHGLLIGLKIEGNEFLELLFKVVLSLLELEVSFSNSIFLKT